MILSKIRESAKYISQQSQHVQINETALKKYANQIHENEIKHWFGAFPDFLKKKSLDEILMFTFLFDTTSFSYWGKPRWRLFNQDGSKIGGAISLITCYKKAIKNNFNLLKPNYLKKLKLDDYKEIVQIPSGIEIPLLKKRHHALVQTAQFLADQYDNSVLKFLEKNNFETEEILKNLLKNVDEYHDIHSYKNKKIPILKRAQLTISDFNHCLQKFSNLKIKNTDLLTACADYKLPQLLRHCDVLVYSKDLGKKIDNLIEIPAGSEEEIEIRMLTIHVVEKLKAHLKQKGYSFTSMEINDFIWLALQKDIQNIKPYHRTRTVFY